MTNKDDETELTISIMPHKENKSAAVFIKGFKDEKEAEVFCRELLHIRSIKFSRFLGGSND